MPVLSFRQAVIERKIELANYTITMLGRAMAQLDRANRDTAPARRYLQETEAYLVELRSELQALRGTAAADSPSDAGEEAVDSVIGRARAEAASRAMS